MKFINTLKMRCLLMVKQNGFLVSFSLMLAFCMASYILNCIAYYGKDASQIICAYNLLPTAFGAPLYAYFEMLFPFLIVFPFCFGYINDSRRNNISVIIIRSSKRDYYISSALAAFLGAFSIMFIPLMISLALNTMTFPTDSVLDFSNMYTYSAQHIQTYWENTLFIDIYLSHPLIHNIIFIAITSVTAGCGAVFVFSLSFLLKKFGLILFLPFYILHILSLNMSGKFKSDIYYFDYIMHLCPEPNKNIRVIIIFNAALLLYGGAMTFIMTRKDELQ